MWINPKQFDFEVEVRHSYGDVIISYTFKVFYIIEHWLDLFILRPWLIMAWIFKPLQLPSIYKNLRNTLTAKNSTSNNSGISQRKRYRSFSRY